MLTKRKKMKVYRALCMLVACGVLIGGLGGCQRHSHTMEVRVIKEATCRESGEQQHFCSTCDYEEAVETIEKVEHTYDDGVEVLPVTCTTDGEKIYMCTACGVSKIEEIKAGHTWKEEEIKEATCYSAGKTRMTCTVCGEVEEVEEKKKSHLFNSDDECIYCDALKFPDFPPNQWRVHAEYNMLQFQNASVTNAFISGQGKGITLTYYPICSSCHIVGQPFMATPTINYPVTKIYYCVDCEAATTLQFRIVS